MVGLPLTNQGTPPSEPNMTRRVGMEIYKNGFGGFELSQSPEIFGNEAIGFIENIQKYKCVLNLYSE